MKEKSTMMRIDQETKRFAGFIEGLNSIHNVYFLQQRYHFWSNRAAQNYKP